MFSKRSSLLRNVALAALIALPVSVTGTTDGWSQIDEIVVTTRKREENLQNVPIAVEAFGSQQISNFGINNASDLAKFSAAIQFDEGFGGQDTRIVIRGLSPTRGRPNAAFLVDGIDFTGEAVSTAGGGFLVNNRLVDVERIEIVKGPQSALYGRSAFAGAVQYITKNPNMDEFEGEAGFDIATDDQYEASATVSGPINDSLGLLVNGLWYDEGGFHDNVITGNEVGGTDGWGLSATTLWEATDDLSFKFRAAYSEDDIETRPQARVPENFFQMIPKDLTRTSGIVGPGNIGLYPGCQGVTAVNGTPAADGKVGTCFTNPKLLVAGTIPDGDDLEVRLSPDPESGTAFDDFPGSEVETLNLSLVSTWDVDFGTFTSLTGYAKVESDQNIDSTWDALPAGDYTTSDGLVSYTIPDCGAPDCSPTTQEIDFANETELVSQEFRFQSDIEGPVQFTIGGLYWNEQVRQVENSITITDAYFRGVTNDPGQNEPAYLRNLRTFGTTNNVGRDTEHWSLYGMVEWEISEQFKATFETRYVEEEIEVFGAVCDPYLTRANVRSITGVDLDPDGNPLNGSSACDSFMTPSSPVLIGGELVQASVSSLHDLTGPLGEPDGIPDGVAKTSESFMAPKLTLEWIPNDDMTFYVSYAQGVKPGGVSTVTAGSFFDNQNNNYDAEKLSAYEVGAKMDLLDNTLRLNSNVFFQQYEDKQVGVSNFSERAQSDVGTIINAGEAEIWGVEIEALWRPIDQLTLQGQYTWLDAEYTSFLFDTTSTTNIARNLAAGGKGCIAVTDFNAGDPVFGNSADALCTLDLSGTQVEDVPEHAFVGNAEWRAPLSNTEMDWFVGGTTAFVSERTMDEYGLKKLDSYWTSDLRAGLAAENWDLLFYVENVFDDDTVKTGVDSGSQVATTREMYFPPAPNDGVFVTLPDPRVFGVRGKIRF